MAYKNIELNPTQYSLQQTSKQSQFYVGYSTLNEDGSGSSKLYDFDIIRQDIINHFNTFFLIITFFNCCFIKWSPFLPIVFWRG